jgi:hypothetical protein
VFPSVSRGIGLRDPYNGENLGPITKSGSFWLYWSFPRILGLPKLSSLYNRAIALRQTAPPNRSFRSRIAMSAA